MRSKANILQRKTLPHSKQLYPNMKTVTIRNFLVNTCEGHLKHYVPFMRHNTQTGQNI